jgi:hypothetical protein
VIYVAGVPITSSIQRFCLENDLGETLVRQMIADGRLRAVRVGPKKILVDLRSWEELIDKQNAGGLPEYSPIKKTIETRRANRAKKAAAKSINLADLGLL